MDVRNLILKVSGDVPELIGLNSGENFCLFKMGVYGNHRLASDMDKMERDLFDKCLLKKTLPICILMDGDKIIKTRSLFFIGDIQVEEDEISSSS